MPKFHIVLDTNIYRKSPSRTDLSFLALNRLCKAGIAQLHLPYIIEREFQTQQSQQYGKELETAVKGLDSVLRKGISEELAVKVENLRDELKTIGSSILTDVEDALPKWVEANGGVRHPLTQSQAAAAMESYFRGTLPLKAIKIRDDIPDAFIYQTVLSLSVAFIPLIVIAEDAKIAEACEKLEGVTVYRSLLEFIESKPIQAEILELDVVDNLEAIFAEIKTFEENLAEISALVTLHGGDSLYGKKIYSRSIPDDNHEAVITGFYDAQNVEVDFDELSYFGQGEFGVPFTFDTTVTIVYYIFKADFYAIDEHRMPSVSDHNDHYFEAEDQIDVSVSGTVKLKIQTELLPSVSEEILTDNLKITIDSVDQIEVIE